MSTLLAWAFDWARLYAFWVHGGGILYVCVYAWLERRLRTLEFSKMWKLRIFVKQRFPRQSFKNLIIPNSSYTIYTDFNQARSPLKFPIPLHPD